jgi:hypothetical protein
MEIISVKNKCYGITAFHIFDCLDPNQNSDDEIKIKIFIILPIKNIIND